MPVGCSADGCRAAWAGLGGEGLVDTIVDWGVLQHAVVGSAGEAMILRSSEHARATTCWSGADCLLVFLG